MSESYHICYTSGPQNSWNEWSICWLWLLDPYLIPLYPDPTKILRQLVLDTSAVCTAAQKKGLNGSSNIEPWALRMSDQTTTTCILIDDVW